MPNDYLSVLYKHIIQVENENVGLKVGVGVGVGWGHKHTTAPNQKCGGHMPPCPSPAFYASGMCVYVCMYVCMYVCVCVCVCVCVR